MCKHSRFVVGRIYICNFDGATCGHCGSPAYISVEGIYMGHQEICGVVRAVFSLQSFPCPGCGTDIIQVNDPCDGGNYYEIETSIPVENWPIKKEAIT
jgi:predicted RNA-binding Zn-ribbon protein involved in translation (DUF1610 family)